MSTPDILVIECPICKKHSPVSIYSGNPSGKEFGIENAPLSAITEAHYESKEGRIECIHCNTTLYIQVVFAPQVRVFSDREREGWKIV